MNIRLTVSNQDGLLDAEGSALNVDTTVHIDMLIDPFYATEADIYKIYLDEIGEYEEDIRRIIFESSIEIDRLLTSSVIANLNMSSTELFMLKREFVICKSAYEFGKRIHRDYMKSVKKSKFLADVKVSLEIENDPTMLKSILGDASDCVDSIVAELTEVSSGFNISSFVKGSTNPCSRTSHREWYPGQGNNYPKVPIASRKIGTFCRKYKIGGQS